MAKSILQLLTGGSSKQDPNAKSEPNLSSQDSYNFETQNDESYSESEEESATQKKEEWLDEESEEGQLTLDVYQDGDDIVIKSTIAGVRPEDLDVTINNDMVSIQGERKRDEEVLDSSYYYQELYWGSFSRSVILPSEVDPERAEATMENGILTVRLPKKSAGQKKKLEVEKRG